MTGTTMAPAEAMALARQAESMEAPLRRRAEGVTWMVWGIAAGSIWLTYEAITPYLFVGEQDSTSLWFDFLWMVWVLLAAVETWGVWRLAALHWRGDRPAASATRLALGWIAAGALAWLVIALVWRELNPEVLPVLAIGSGWLLLAAVDPMRSTRDGRITMAGIGGATLVLGIILGLLFPGGWGDVTLGLAMGRAAASGLPAILGGTWQVLRG